MAAVREIEAKFVDWEARYLLAALSREMERLKRINSESEDEDEAADAGNDYLEISGLYERLSSEAVSTFGGQILEFSDE